MDITSRARVQAPRAEHVLPIRHGFLPRGLDPTRFPIIAEHVFGLAPLRRNARPDAKPIAIDYERVGAGTFRHIGAIPQPAGQRVVPLPGAAK